MPIVTCVYCNTPGLMLCKTKAGARLYHFDSENSKPGQIKFKDMHSCQAYMIAKGKIPNPNTMQPINKSIIKPACTKYCATADDGSPIHTPICPNRQVY
jgi:hypothetical protein